jgi:hypothetical protein
MQFAPNLDNDHLWAIDVDGSALVHVPHPKEALLLAYDGNQPGAYETACGMVGEAGIYVADEYDTVAPDFCPECLIHVVEQRLFLAEMKVIDVADALKGIGVNVPVTIIKSGRPFSASPDRLYDPAPSISGDALDRARHDRQVLMIGVILIVFGIFVISALVNDEGWSGVWEIFFGFVGSGLALFGAGFLWYWISNGG